jgi:hypothetical protein
VLQAVTGVQLGWQWQKECTRLGVGEERGKEAHGLDGCWVKDKRQGEVQGAERCSQGGGPASTGGCDGVWAAGNSWKRVAVGKQGHAVGIW